MRIIICKQNIYIHRQIKYLRDLNYLIFDREIK